MGLGLPRYRYRYYIGIISGRRERGWRGGSVPVPYLWGTCMTRGYYIERGGVEGHTVIEREREREREKEEDR